MAEPVPQAPPPPVKFLLAKLTVLQSKYEAFEATMKTLIPIMSKNYQWKLLFAGYPQSGKVGDFVHLWEVPREDSVGQVMTDAASNASQSPSLVSFQTAYLAVQELIVDTHHQFFASLPFDPNLLGRQSQTVVIDAVGKVWILDHDDLENNKDIKPLPEADPTFSKLKVYLDEGATTGRILDSKLFFNLAGIAPLSLFQARDLIKPILPLAIAPEYPEGNASDAKLKPTQTLLLAMPSGNVFELGPDDLRKIGQPIPPANDEDTRKVLRPLVDGFVGLASVPDPTQAGGVTGIGCMCYVINLASFPTSAADVTDRNQVWP